MKTKNWIVYMCIFIVGLIIGFLINNLSTSGNAIKATNQNPADQIAYKDALHTNQTYLEKYQLLLKMQGPESAKQLDNEVIKYLKAEGLKPEDINDPQLQGIFGDCKWWCKHFPNTWIVGLFCPCGVSDSNASDVN